MACNTARQAFCWVSLILPIIKPACLNAPSGKFDQRCFCAVSVQSNSTVSFSVSFSVARKAFAAATMAGVAFCPVVDRGVVVPSAVAAPFVVAPAVAALVAAGALVASAAG